MPTRRSLIQTFSALPLTGLASLAYAQATTDRILVIVELSGGNDGLNTIVPHGDDTYYSLRPNIAIHRKDTLPIDDHFGFNPGMLGFKRLWETGDLAIVHGCGYAQPSYSHFTSMAYWHTAAPNTGNEYGWVGRLADAMTTEQHPNFLINVGARQSLAVKSKYHQPIVFDDPNRFERRALAAARDTMAYQHPKTGNSTQQFLHNVAQSAKVGSKLIQEAWSRYESNVDYGIAPIDLPKVAACIDAGMRAPLYYVTFRNNAFDTHVEQPNLHRRLLSYACDAIHGFLRDIDAMGHGDRVAVLAFSEFGRRAPENSNLGTDHGAAGPMFLAGKPIVGGHYGMPPALTNLTEDDNLKHTTDFRNVYATAIDEWIAPGRATQVLNGNYPSLGIFSA